MLVAKDPACLGNNSSHFWCAFGVRLVCVGGSGRFLPSCLKPASLASTRRIPIATAKVSLFLPFALSDGGKGAFPGCLGFIRIAPCDDTVYQWA